MEKPKADLKLITETDNPTGTSLLSTKISRNDKIQGVKPAE